MIGLALRRCSVYSASLWVGGIRVAGCGLRVSKRKANAKWLELARDLEAGQWTPRTEVLAQCWSVAGPT